MIPPGEDGIADSSVISCDIAKERLAKFLHQYDINAERFNEKLKEIDALLDKEDGVRSFFINVKCPELFDKYLGKTEHLIHKIFEEARSRATYYTPVVIFFDDMEAVFGTRGTGLSSNIETTIVPQFLSEIDGIKNWSNLVIIGASNRQDMIDPAILRPGRLDVKIKIERPTRDSARDIFSMYLLPTFPLSAEGITLPSTVGPGEVVFRSAYQRAVDPQQRAKVTQDVHVEDIKDLRELLPEGCDFRLAFSLQPSDLKRISNQSKAIVREIIDRELEESQLKIKLRRFKANLEVGKIVKYLQELHNRYTRDTVVRQAIDKFIKQEWLAETMILHVTDLLYSSTSMISVLTKEEKRYNFSLKDFISGALIANMVDRAKRNAVKLLTLAPWGPAEISLHDLFMAIEQEFGENKEQLALNRLHSELGRMEEKILSVEVSLSRSPDMRSR